MNARRLTAAVAIFAMVFGGIVAVVLLVGTIMRHPQASQPAAPPARPTPQMPIPVEFEIGVIVTDQDCSGPTSCIYKYRIEPKYLGRHPLPDREITVAYEVTGGNEPQVGDFTVFNGQARVLQDVVLEGPPGARLQAAVTQIS